ncbi:MAG: SurA N-terminal domain-containing protein [Patescibacteria group bacterium]|nr:SurA N-terminal domain-containing protein [Patescibacteria group bacterium]
MATKKTKNTTKRIAVKPEASQKKAKQTSITTPSFKIANPINYLSNKKIIIGIAAVIIAGILYFEKGLFIAATVNGEPVSRLSVIQSLEKQNGKTALESTITKMLIEQEAKKKNIVVSQSEIDTQLKQIEGSIAQQGQKLDDVLASQGMTRSDLIEQIKLQKMLEKLAGNNITVTDKEIEAFIESNKSSFSQDATQDAMKQEAKQQLTQQKLNDKYQALIADLQKNAKITYFVNY